MAKRNAAPSLERYLSKFADDFDLDCRIEYATFDCSYRIRFSTRDQDARRRRHAEYRLRDFELESLDAPLVDIANQIAERLIVQVTKLC